MYLKQLALLPEQCPVVVWDKDHTLELLSPLSSYVCWTRMVPAACSHGDVCPDTGFLLLVGVSGCSVSSFGCSTISYLQWTWCSFAQVSALVFLGICSFSIFKLQKTHYKARSGSQFDRQHGENSPETAEKSPEQDVRSRCSDELVGSSGNHLRKKSDFELPTGQISRRSSSFASPRNKMIGIKEVVI